jgi:hypothetical protein
MVFQSLMPHWSDRGTGNIRYVLHIVPGPVETSLNTGSSVDRSGIAWGVSSATTYGGRCRV